MSRAACSASVASVACSEPTCLCASPLRLRMKTSQSGMGCVAIIASFDPLRSSCVAALSFLRICERGLAHPAAFLMRPAPRREAVTIARPVPGQYLIELFPVDRAVPPVPVAILLHGGIGNGQAEVVRLRHRRIDEFLAQLVIGEALDLPSGR